MLISLMRKIIKQKCSWGRYNCSWGRITARILNYFKKFVKCVCMIDKINIWLIKKCLARRSQLDDFEKEKVEYALSVLFNETEKLIGIIFVFLIIGRVKMFLVSFIVLMSLRIFIGGFHFSKRYQCFLFTLLFFMVTVFLSEIFIVDKALGIGLFCLGFMNIVLCAPLPSKHRILVSERGKKRLRNQSKIVILMWIICYIFIFDMLANIILWTVMVQQIEILYSKITHGRKVKNE